MRRDQHNICAITHKIREIVSIDGDVFTREKLWIFCELSKNRYVSENLILF